MSGNNEIPPPPPMPTGHHNFALLSILLKEKLTGPNYLDWMRNLNMTLHFDNKEYVLDHPVPDAPNHDASVEDRAAYDKHYDDASKVSCIMIATMSVELQKTFEDVWAFDMNLRLAEMFHKKARQERFEVVKALMACKLKEGDSVCAH